MIFVQNGRTFHVAHCARNTVRRTLFRDLEILCFRFSQADVRQTIQAQSYPFLSPSIVELVVPVVVVIVIRIVARLLVTVPSSNHIPPTFRIELTFIFIMEVPWLLCGQEQRNSTRKF